MSEIYTFSQHIFQNRAYRLTFFWLFEDTPTRNHPISSQNQLQQQTSWIWDPRFGLDRTQVYMKSEHLAEAKRNSRSWPLLTIINYNDTTTFNNNNNLYEWSGSSLNSNPPSLDYTPPWGKFLALDLEVPTPRNPPYEDHHHHEFLSYLPCCSYGGLTPFRWEICAPISCELKPSCGEIVLGWDFKCRFLFSSFLWWMAMPKHQGLPVLVHLLTT